MFDLDGALLSPDRRPVSLGEITGRRGLIVAAVGRGGERGFQMVHRFHDVGERLADAGIHLAFVYPRESARHVLDPVSIASMRFQRHPLLLLDPVDRYFWQIMPARSLAVVHLGSNMVRLASINIDLREAAWETEVRSFLVDRQAAMPH
ncbi:MAG TPA: hypothetical protein VJU59_51005 [Paraburkholderia sp.]|uniref:hypothetical protein n=1 Tax=Paraburkholderia sp. TaxID=1926495 RepID=UPI002B46AE01|nr:hypothetical protein [Paraburkholderia sp.]HKR47912.1 hypothetical protein [Paraburkholderia sp.]